MATQAPYYAQAQRDYVAAIHRRGDIVQYALRTVLAETGRAAEYDIDSHLRQVKAPLTPDDFACDTAFEPPADDLLETIETLVEEAIARASASALDAVHGMIRQLDVLDPDPDLEPCPAGDDGCQYFTDGCREGWGYYDQSGGPAPDYGEDQSEGPLTSVRRPYSGYSSTCWQG